MWFLGQKDNWQMNKRTLEAIWRGGRCLCVNQLSQRTKRVSKFQGIILILPFEQEAQVSQVQSILEGLVQTL